MINPPLPKAFAAAFEDWCKECECNPGDDAFQLSLAVSFENFARLHLEAIATAQNQLADAFRGISLTDAQAAPRLVVSGAGTEGGKQRLESAGSQFADAVLSDTGASAFRPVRKT